MSPRSNFDPACCSFRFVLLENLGGGLEVPRRHPEKGASFARLVGYLGFLCFPENLTGAASGEKELWEASTVDKSYSSRVRVQPGPHEAVTNKKENEQAVTSPEGGSWTQCLMVAFCSLQNSCAVRGSCPTSGFLVTSVFTNS